MHKIAANKLKEHTRLFIFLILSALSAAKQYDEGDFCDFAGYKGTCLKATRCAYLSALAHTLDLKREQIGHCGFSVMEEIICCPLPIPQSTEPNILEEFKPTESRALSEESSAKSAAGIQIDTVRSNVKDKNILDILDSIFKKNVEPIVAVNENERIKMPNGNPNERLIQLFNVNVPIHGNAEGSIKGSNDNRVPAGKVRQRLQDIDIFAPDKAKANLPCETRHYNGSCKTKLQCRHLAASLADMRLNETDVAYCAQEDLICCPNIERLAVRACRDIERSLGPYQGGHVFGGHKVSATEYRFMAHILYDRPDHICGGTLIHKRFVLTAAHCVIVRGVNAEKVILGVANITDPKEARYRQDIRIKRMIAHEQYSSFLNYFDIAVIELAKAAVYSLTVYPTCLHTDQTELPDGIKLTTAGWGFTENGKTSEHLLAVEVNKLSLSHCNQSYALGRGLEHGIDDTQLCALAHGKDSCYGDSGGPLFLSKNAAYNMYRVVGIVSFGSKACGGTVPGVYTRVSKFLDFVEAIVWADELH
ncbi:PREDICTED: venom serine protease Bi-VSP-like [Bactrocera latifrons]|uniref:venom serine protease Bi-VSP-like n=1 Tax=Bactrocera latifrons TaxID=174628 RepID=UPI0008DE500E|nr:PREDICTED: venom serine protease Bi-VSP-like [Bactrocera latifrons]